MNKNFNISICLLLISVSCWGTERVGFLGCDWNIPNKFVERGGDKISQSSWFYLDRQTYKSIYFENIAFELKKHIETNTFLGESVISGLQVYEFENIDESLGVTLKSKIITKDNTSYILLINLSDNDLIEFSKNCKE
ncbi:hypothetical protein [Teredinibacter turnerae]|uniref:hypothetical protein n=1 Tax=Teredinibacter turnerae TaxID=2426 RepID=UPI00048F8C9A|nr:hypothetical protein [Teredinibacter turnerae]